MLALAFSSTVPLDRLGDDPHVDQFGKLSGENGARHVPVGKQFVEIGHLVSR
jgi:hypothetical protein